MNTAYIIVTVISAVWVGFSAFSLYRKADFVAQPLNDYGVPESWWPWLATAKAAGAVGLLAGLWIPYLTLAAGIGIILYFLGAVITVLRARSYKTVAFPVLYLVPVVVALGLGLAAGSLV
ncbi:DoxX family protein [Phytomonospora sp. NPDC050363]|uniref:DoxX family protein n=1 Tax=Phytomonospora sp. NPDC050363 TaxID=3155642 RepID=UPI0033CED541